MDKNVLILAVCQLGCNFALAGLYGLKISRTHLYIAALLFIWITGSMGILIRCYPMK